MPFKKFTYLSILMVSVLYMNAANSTDARFNTYDEIPYLLKQFFKPQLYKEEYLFRSLQNIRTRSNGDLKKQEQLLKGYSLTSNQDLYLIAEKAFNTVDTDSDNVISQDEYERYQGIKEDLLSRWQDGYTRVTQVRPSIPASKPQTCSFENAYFPPDMKVYATGQYGGTRLGFQIDDSGHEAHRIEVTVNKPNENVALILGSYEPTIWKISRTPETNIVAVLAGGYHKQIVSGLAENVPVLTTQHGKDSPCGYFYLASNKLEKLNPMSRMVFSMPADMFYEAKSGRALIGEQPYDPADIITDNEQPLRSYKITGQMAGPAGLEQLAGQGVLRRATAADAQAWLQAQMRQQQKQPTLDIPPTAGGNSIRSNVRPIRIMHNAYVVLQAFEFPPGLYGANSGTFIVPRGVETPIGNPGHSSVYDMNTLTCKGPMCRSN